MKNKTGIYKIVNKANGNVYYGSATISFSKRWAQHRNKLKNNTHDNFHLQAAWNKYGSDSFEFSIALLCEKEKCIYFEQQFLNKYWDNCKNCYNISPTAGNISGYKHSLEVRRQMSQRLKGNKYGIGNRSNSGLNHTPKSRQKISMAHKGKPKTEIQKLRMSRAASKGERHHNAKLKNKQVLEIRELFTTKAYDKQKLANMFGVSRGTIRDIISRRTYANLI